MENEADKQPKERIVVAISGASGPILGIRLIEELLNLNTPVTAVVSESAWKVIGYEIEAGSANETGLSAILKSRGLIREPGLLSKFLREAGDREIDAPEASGSTFFKALVVIPCSMKTLSAVSHGYAQGLIARMADVALKERRRCILVPRETPLNLIHIENMRRAMQAGAEIVPPIPAFYTKAQGLDDVIDFITGKILNLLGRPHNLFTDWESRKLGSEQ